MLRINIAGMEIWNLVVRTLVKAKYVMVFQQQETTVTSVNRGHLLLKNVFKMDVILDGTHKKQLFLMRQNVIRQTRIKANSMIM